MPDSSQLPTFPLVLTAAATGLLSAGGLLAYSIFASRCQFWAPVIRSLRQSDAVALTFDDGPHPEFTPRILDILAEAGVRASFFVIGRHARQHPEIIRRIHAAGHTLGNHTLDHDHFGINRNRAYWQRQVGETQRIVGDITGEPPYLFRPPMGFKNWHVAAAAREYRIPVVGWSVRAYDTQAMGAEMLARRVLKRTTGFDIVLLHDGVDPERMARSKGGGTATQMHTVEALPLIIKGIQEKTLQAVSLIEALIASAADQARIVARIREQAAS